MSDSLTSGKIAGLNSISDRRGVIAALALDQRGILRNALARAKGTEDVDPQLVMEFKEIVTSVLTPHASAILLDVEYGLPAARRRGHAGLLLAYERSCYDAAPPRLPLLYDMWSVLRIKEAGADCVKVLLHYTPFDSEAINDLKRVWVERIGDECRANDIAFVLELLGYDQQGREKSLEYARIKPEIVARSIREFSAERYGVDLLKVEVPIQLNYVAGASCCGVESAYTRSEAQEHFLAVAAATSKPFVYLSAGVTNAQFLETLEMAAECGSRFNGVLCGRATWQDGVAVHAQHGAAALEKWLNTAGRKNIERVNHALKVAKPWHELSSIPTPTTIQD